MSIPRKSGPPRPSKGGAVPPSRAGIVRLDRVVEARRRIQEGWYDRHEVRSQLVEAVLNELESR